MRLIIDTETTGLRRTRLSVDDASQPRIIQLAAAVYSAKWKRVQSFVVLIKPDGWAIEPEAQGHHGITEQACAKYGVPIVVALAMLQGFCEAAIQIVGHHVEFDRNMITHELATAGADGMWWQRRAPSFVCTQELGTPLCQLSGNFGQFKFPTLEELFRFLFPAEPFTVTHEAEHDVLQTARIAQELERRGILKPPLARPAVLDGAWRNRT